MFHILRNIFLFCLLSLMIACNPAPIVEKPTVTLSPEPSPSGMCDCFYPAEIHVWNDINQNGVFDKGEPPIEGVQFYLRANHSSDNLVSATSDADGYAIWDYGTGDCACFNWTFEIIFDIPKGYKLISKKWVEAQNDIGRLYEVALTEIYPSASPTP